MKSKVLLISLLALVVASCVKQNADHLSVATLSVTDVKPSDPSDPNGKQTATFEGETSGKGQILERGFIVTFKDKFTVNDSSKIAAPGDGPFQISPDTLTLGNQFYIKAYAITSSGIVYGDYVFFIVGGKPVVIDQTKEEDVRATAITFRGNITSTGGADITGCGIYLDGRKIESTNLANAKTGGAFSVYVDGLTPESAYTVQFFAANQNGEMMTDPRTFVTTKLVLEVSAIETDKYAAIAQGLGLDDFVTLRGMVDTKFDKILSGYGFRYGTSPDAASWNPSDDVTVGTDIDEGVEFDYKLEGLSPLTKIYYSAYIVVDGEVLSSRDIRMAQTCLVDRRADFTQWPLDASSTPVTTGLPLYYFDITTTSKANTTPLVINIDGQKYAVSMLDRNLGATELPTATAWVATCAGNYYKWGFNGKTGGKPLSPAYLASVATPVMTGQSEYVGGDATTRWSVLALSDPNVMNPCPDGYRPPTMAEIMAIINTINAAATANDLLARFNMSGSGNIQNNGTWASQQQIHLWTDQSDPVTFTSALFFNANNQNGATSFARVRGMPVRCVKLTPQ